MTDNQKKLITILEEMFQLDQADLDFGIYRIMALKREEIKKFLNNDLISQIMDDLKQLLDISGKNQLEEVNKEIENARLMNISESIKNAMIAELEEKKKILNSQVNIEDIEGEIYSHLTNFFERYYVEGDFISQRRYKDGAYAIPYEGEEVKLHWANADQYYIKTSEYFKDYVFKTCYGNTVHFKLIEAETDKDNNKSNDKRFFQLYTDKPFEIKDNELVMHFEYKNGCRKNQNECIIEAVAAFSKEVSAYQDYTSILVVKDGKSHLERHLSRYTARNTYDYFIHKDLGKFLSRELDFYIKNDVIYLDDIDEQDEAKTKLYLVKAKIIRKIARKIIAFLSQIENFQKKLWLKKKFIVETNYCITLDRVPEKFYNEIIQNIDQIEEWKKLFAIHEIKGDLVLEAYSEPLTKAFLRQNKFLVLDTAFFSVDFKEQLVESIADLDEQLDGLLIHSENFQALNLLEEKYRKIVKCIHIDPPYNTTSSGFLYKNNYQHSSWMSMMHDRILISIDAMKTEASFLCHIDENEYENLCSVFQNIGLINLGTVIWDKRNPMTGGKGLATQHEYVIWRSKENITINLNTTNVAEMLDYAAMLIKNGGINNRVREEYSDWINKNKNLSGGEKSYRYIDDDGKVYQSVSLRAPEPRSDAKFHQPLIHPVKNKPCAIPPNGFSRTPETLADMVKRNEILFGEDETTQPRQKMFLKETTKRQMTTIVQDAKKGKADTDLLGVYFPYCHPVSFYMTLLGAAVNNQDSVILDFFAGSGTTGHAVINLNREDNGNRKYILVEMGEYFDTVTKPRIEKVIYSEDWKDGKPVSCKGSSHAFKYIRLESYEDTLNNLTIKSSNIGFIGDIAEQYMINYMLEIETKDSDSLLNIDKFDKPFNYTMSITRKLESVIQNIDLVETFNYLIGLKVKRSYAIQTFDADFKKGEYGVITADIKDGNTFKIKMIEGRTIAGDSILVIWRELTSDKVKDNAVLDAFFVKKKLSTTNFIYNKIYVNGDNNLPNLRMENEGWKVILIEEEIRKRMFEEV